MNSAPTSNLKGRPRRILDYLKLPLVATLCLTGGDALVLISTVGASWRSSLVLVLLLEGGLGLLGGTGIALSSTPSISKVGETILGTAAWSKDGEKHAERVGLKWILGSCLLVAIGFGLSML